MYFVCSDSNLIVRIFQSVLDPSEKESQASLLCISSNNNQVLDSKKFDNYFLTLNGIIYVNVLIT